MGNETLSIGAVSTCWIICETSRGDSSETKSAWTYAVLTSTSDNRHSVHIPQCKRRRVPVQPLLCLQCPHMFQLISAFKCQSPGHRNIDVWRRGLITAASRIDLNTKGLQRFEHWKPFVNPIQKPHISGQIIPIITCFILAASSLGTLVCQSLSVVSPKPSLKKCNRSKKKRSISKDTNSQSLSGPATAT